MDGQNDRRWLVWSGAPLLKQGRPIASEKPGQQKRWKTVTEEV